MDIIDLGLSDFESISTNTQEQGPYNTSSGVEFLMNDKKKGSSGSMNIDLGDLDSLEKELNDLSSSSANDSKSVAGLGGSFSNFFGLGETKKVEVNDNSSLGQSTSDSMGNTKTWDGFSKMNEIPQSAFSSSSKLSELEKRRKKRMMLKKIDDWFEKGIIKNNPHFTLESDYDEIEDEYETALEGKRQKDSVKLQGWWFMTAVNSIEYANSAFDPFDINLDGWGEQVGDDIDSYEDIFEELYDKYKGGKLSPEISLLLRLGFSAAVLNFTNKALAASVPSASDTIRHNPELKKMFTNATIDAMSQSSPGFAMANNLMKESQQGPSMNMGPPPAPIETKYMPQTNEREGNNVNQYKQPSTRPDIAMGRGASLQRPPTPMNGRQEMRGPSTDIDSILSGLKTKVVNEPTKSIDENTFVEYGMDSIISVSSIADMQNGNIPKKTRRRGNTSLGNTVSLDI
jgi:hypothetical protein